MMGSAMQMKRLIACLVLLIGIAFFAPMRDAKAADWKWVTSTDCATIEVDVSNPTMANNIITFSDRWTYIDSEERNHKIQRLSWMAKKQGYDVDFSNFRYSESLIKSYQRIFMGKSTVSSNIIETTFYDDDDNIIFIEDVPSGYFEVANGSIGEGEYNTVWPYAFVNSGGRGIF